jgi:hypothetical protein
MVDLIRTYLRKLLSLFQSKRKVRLTAPDIYLLMLNRKEVK